MSSFVPSTTFEPTLQFLKYLQKLLTYYYKNRLNKFQIIYLSNAIY